MPSKSGGEKKSITEKLVDKDLEALAENGRELKKLRKRNMPKPTKCSKCQFEEGHSQDCPYYQDDDFVIPSKKTDKPTKWEEEFDKQFGFLYDSDVNWDTAVMCDQIKSFISQTLKSELARELGEIKEYVEGYDLTKDGILLIINSKLEGLQRPLMPDEWDSVPDFLKKRK